MPQAARLVSVTGRARRVAARLAQLGEGQEDRVQEEAEPDALSAALRADLVHPVVPVAACRSAGSPWAPAVSDASIARAAWPKSVSLSDETVGSK